MTHEPYIIETETITVRYWNKDYNQDELCICGHTYYRHFDPYEDMYPRGCKYCQCSDFVPGGGKEEIE